MVCWKVLLLVKLMDMKIMSYIDRGWITQDEYENLHDYLYKPYEKMGGNGSAKKVMSEVNKLPIHKSTYTQKNQ